MAWSDLRRPTAALVLAASAGTLSAADVVAQSDREAAPKQERPSISISLTPRAGLAPVEVRAVVELKGGSDNFEEYYCATLEWEWDDGALSESTTDCAPYDPKASEIQRRFTASHKFVRGGQYRITFRLKKKDKVVSMASGIVRVSGGNPFGT
jgi:hypothetical protein